MKITSGTSARPMKFPYETEESCCFFSSVDALIVAISAIATV